MRVSIYQLGAAWFFLLLIHKILASATRWPRPRWNAYTQAMMSRWLWHMA